jgi:hypothetical protein
MKKQLTILVIAVIVALGAGFFGGTQYQKMTTKKIVAQMPGGFNRGNFSGSVNGQRNRNGAGFTTGSILSKNDNTSFTVKLNSGGSEIVFLSPSSKIMKSATSSINDLNVGDQVVVSGTANSDGSITASTVQLGDFRMGGNRPAGQTPPAQGK